MGHDVDSNCRMDFSNLTKLELAATWCVTIIHVTVLCMVKPLFASLSAHVSLINCQSKPDKGGESALRRALAIGSLMEEKEDKEREKEDVYLRLELVLLTLKIPYLWYKYNSLANLKLHWSELLPVYIYLDDSLKSNASVFVVIHRRW